MHIRSIFLKQLMVLSVVFLGLTMNETTNAQVKIGVFADCQYCDCETAGNRFYRNSLVKLNECLAEFNTNELDFVIGLGDLIDRNFSSFKPVNTILAKSENPVYHVTGNHDFSVENDFLEKVPSALNLEKTYYTIGKNNWQFIFLNGNEISIQSNDEKTIKTARKMLDELTAKNLPNNKDWNGGLGKKQIKWLEKELKTAERNQKKVVLFCHYPLLPHEAHTLWDSEKVLQVINKYNCVKAWINGHNHAGNYVSYKGIHFITMKGMVDTEEQNAFSTISFSGKEIMIEGFGREESRKLPLKD